MLILDNLFLNIDITRALLVLNIATYSITRKNATRFLSNLIKVKNHNRLYL